MRKLLIILLNCLAASVFAQTTYVFRVETETLKLRGDYITTEPVGSYTFLDGEGFKLAVLEVTESQWTNGYANLNSATVSNLISVAESNETEWLEWEVRERAIMDYVVSELNVLRGMPAINLAPLGTNDVRTNLQGKIQGRGNGKGKGKGPPPP